MTEGRMVQAIGSRKEDKIEDRKEKREGAMLSSTRLARS